MSPGFQKRSNLEPHYTTYLSKFPGIIYKRKAQQLCISKATKNDLLSRKFKTKFRNPHTGRNLVYEQIIFDFKFFEWGILNIVCLSTIIKCNLNIVDPSWLLTLIETNAYLKTKYINK